MGQQKTKIIEKEEYIKSLESLLIFMCRSHKVQQEELLTLAKEGNDAFFEISHIQGTNNVIPISKIADLEFNQPRYGFKEVEEEILRKQKNKK